MEGSHLMTDKEGSEGNPHPLLSPLPTRDWAPGLGADTGLGRGGRASADPPAQGSLDGQECAQGLEVTQSQ